MLVPGGSVDIFCPKCGALSVEALNSGPQLSIAGGKDSRGFIPTMVRCPDCGFESTLSKIRFSNIYLHIWVKYRKLFPGCVVDTRRWLI